MRQDKCAIALSGATLLFFAGLSIQPAQASTFFFADQAQFLESAGPLLQFESFENFPASDPRGSRDPSDRNFVSLDDFTITAIPPELSGEFFGVLAVLNRPTLGIFPTDGQNYLLVGSQSYRDLNYPIDTDERITRFDFNTPINSFGLTLTTRDFDVGKLIFSTNTGASVEIMRVAPFIEENQLFFGMVNLEQPFTRVELTHFEPGQFYGVDAIYYGLSGQQPTDPQPVPEPSAGLGLAIAAGLGYGSRLLSSRCSTS